MSYQLKVIKDNPIGFWLLDETSGSTAADYSGCGNDGTYSGGITNNLLPLVPGGTQGTLITSTKSVSFPITKDYYGSTAGGGIADKYSTDNDFSLEVWFYPNITTTNETAIFADTTNDIGLYYDKGNIVFKIGGEELNYTIPYIKKSHHIVACYSVNSLSIYHDGFLVSYKTLSDKISLSNTTTTFSIGPTEDSQDKFIVDCPAVYRYTLTSDKIFSHYGFGQPIGLSQVSALENGTIFQLSNENIKKIYSYSYPIDSSWANFVNDDIVYSTKDNSIAIKLQSSAVAKTVTFDDYIIIPNGIGIQYSKIEWEGDNGVTVQSSIDGIVYDTCTNGQSLPQYEYDNFDTTGKVYLKFTLQSDDASKYNPKLRYLVISFFGTNDLYANNSGEKLTQIDDEYFLGGTNYNVLSRDYRNGLRCKQDGGFKITTDKLIRTLEFFYTPSNLNDSGLVSSLADTTYSASNYIWHNVGTISKTNISAIYVNGINKTSQTDISNVFTAGEIHHVVIVYSSPISADIKFNNSVYGSSEALYKNICLYETAFTSGKALEHFNLYVEKTSEEILDSNTITLTEQTPDIYTNEWILVQSS